MRWWWSRTVWVVKCWAPAPLLNKKIEIKPNPWRILRACPRAASTPSCSCAQAHLGRRKIELGTLPAPALQLRSPTSIYHRTVLVLVLPTRPLVKDAQNRADAAAKRKGKRAAPVGVVVSAALCS